jgi:hypothetical protein
MSTLLTAIGLGLGAGVNAYATLFMFGLLARWKPGMFDNELAAFFSSTPVLITVGVLYLIEFIADKIPAVDHAWDVVHTFIRPAAGAFVGWAASSQEIPQGLVIVASIIAGTAALTTHTAKATLRAGSTVTTAGTANPVISLIEDVFAIFNAVLAVLLPWLVLVVIGGVTLLLVWIYRRTRKRESF